MKDTQNNPAGVGYTEQREMSQGRRDNGYDTQSGRPQQFQEQQFTSTGTTTHYRNAEGDNRDDNLYETQMDDGGNEFVQTEIEWPRFERASQPGNATPHLHGHTLSAPLTEIVGLEGVQQDLQSHTPAYRTTADPATLQQPLHLAGSGAMQDHLVVVTPLVRQDNGKQVEGSNATNLAREDTPENSDVEMLGINEHELMHFRMWEKQGGRKQDERSPGTPSHHQKATPASKKNRKSTGELFPAPRDVNKNWQSPTVVTEVEGGVLSDIAEGNEMQIDVGGTSDTHNSDNTVFGTPGRRGEERKTPPTNPSARKNPSRQ
ncbi:unnamed protein product [Calypogeia fissa]